ncbi:MAG TPA: LamG domain-containing protein, partial [Candidatus Nanoarchaeia archaeon]|nr:LamG domain-containing protein [Candidatus Nanoarchaeia archaeon]
GLIAHWSFNEGSGTQLNDLIGSNTGDLTNMESNDWVTGKYGTALQFDGVNEYVLIPDSDSLSALTNISWSFWFKTSSADYAIFLSKSNSGNYEWSAIKGSSNTQIMIYSDNNPMNNLQCVANAPYYGEWHHAVITWDGVFFYDSPKIYIDGVLTIGSNGMSSGDTIADTDSPITIGGLISGNYFNGAIDEVKIYNRALTLTEVTSLYNYGVINNVNYASCCGDDSASDDFYAGLLSTTSNFCINGANYKASLDSNKTLCESYSEKWVNDVNHMISFTNDAEGTEIPSEMQIVSTFDNNPDVNTTVIDHFKARFKVLKSFLINQVPAAIEELLTLTEPIFFNS